MNDDPNSRRDYVTGVFFASFSLGFLALGLQYDLGTPQRMGPGFFPVVLGAVGLLLSPFIALTGGRPRLPKNMLSSLRPMVAILAGIAAFAILIEPFGLVPAVAATTVLAALGDRSARPGSTLVLVVLVSLGSWLIFRIGLGLHVPAFRGSLPWN